MLETLTRDRIPCKEQGTGHASSIILQAKPHVAYLDISPILLPDLVRNTQSGSKRSQVTTIRSPLISADIVERNSFGHPEPILTTEICPDGQSPQNGHAGAEGDVARLDGGLGERQAAGN